MNQFLAFLRPLVKTAISTNRTTTIERSLNFIGLAGYFDLVVSALDVARPKPHPESLNKILDHFQVRPDEAVYIGDSVVDAEAAQRAGIPLIAYKNPRTGSGPARGIIPGFAGLDERAGRRFPRLIRK